MLEWTGERYLPFIDPKVIGAEIHYEHLHRYAFAAKFAKQKKVLDLASGEGYGSHMLSKEAKQVIGIEIDEKAVEHASAKYCNDNLEFIQGSIVDVPLKGRKVFDVIVCFEALEHIHDHEKLLSEIKRLLKDEGILIISTPNKSAYTDEQKYNNPFHKKELYYENFRNLLMNYFSNIYAFGQKVYTGSNIWQLSSGSLARSDEILIEKNGSSFVIRDDNQKSPLYFIVIASNGDLGENYNINSYFIDSSNTIFVQKDKQISELTSQLQESRSQADALKQVIFERDASIDEMRGSIVWKLTTKFHSSFIGKICPQNSKRRVLYGLGLRGGRVLVNEGWNCFWIRFSEYISSRRIVSKRMTHVPSYSIPNISVEEDVKQIDKKLSIVIPTKNAGRDFEYTIEKIRNQKGIKEIELIIIDSGSNDSTINIAGKYGAKVYEIKPEEFNHGKTRNYAASKASGDYILFMVQDAIPIGDYWSYSLVKVLCDHEDVAAVTCRQVPRSDADLFACNAIWYHYKYLQFNEDKIYYMKEKDFENLPFGEKRKLAGLENVCCCIKKDIFDKFNFREINYAEDLDLGIRLIKNKYKIGFLYSTGVIHSHNRDPDYHLRRGYVNSKHLVNISGEVPPKVFSDINIVLIELVSIYDSLKFSTNILNIRYNENMNVETAFSEIKSNLLKNTQSDAFKCEMDPKLHVLIEKLRKMIDPALPNNHKLYDGYISILEDFEKYLKSNSQDYRASEVINSIYKLFATYCGTCLGYSYYYNLNSEKCIYIDNLLAREI